MSLAAVVGLTGKHWERGRKEDMEEERSNEKGGGGKKAWRKGGVSPTIGVKLASDNISWRTISAGAMVAWGIAM